MNKTQVAALNKMRESKGRFFGLTTTQGNVFNAQFRGETDQYVTVYDRNNYTNRKLAKTSVARVSIG